MAKCTKIPRQSKRVCIGSLKRQIDLLTRSITTPVGGNINFGESLVLLQRVWSMIQTTRGTVMFDDTNTEKEITHKIFIRYIEGLTAETWVRLPSITAGINNLLDIVRIENMEEDNRFMVLHCAIRGDETKAANLA